MTKKQLIRKDEMDLSLFTLQRFWLWLFRYMGFYVIDCIPNPVDCLDNISFFF